MAVSVERRLAGRLLLVWLISTLILTLSPFWPLRIEPRAFGWVDPGSHRLGLFDLSANLALFAPLGVLARVAGLRRRAILLGALLLSAGIEGAQTWIHPRTPSWYDLVANVAGAGLGALLSTELWRLGRAQHRRGLHALLLAAGAAAAVMLVSDRPQLTRYGMLVPFALAVLGALLSSRVWRPTISFALTTGAVLAVCAGPWGAHGVLWIATCTAGAGLGAWPYEVTG